MLYNIYVMYNTHTCMTLEVRSDIYTAPFIKASKTVILIISPLMSNRNV